MSRHSALVVLVALPVLTGCGVRPPLSNDAVASMLLEDRVEKCDQQTVFVRAGRFGLGRAQRTEAWFDNSLLSDPNFKHVVQSTDDAGTHGELTYREHNETFRVTWTQFDRPTDVESNQLSITGCLYVPRGIDIIDASFASDGNSAEVKFQEEFGLSLLGERMRDAGVLKIYDPIGAPGSYEYVALLSRSISGSWRIRGIGTN